MLEEMLKYWDKFWNGLSPRTRKKVQVVALVLFLLNWFLPRVFGIEEDDLVSILLDQLHPSTDEVFREQIEKDEWVLGEIELESLKDR